MGRVPRESRRCGGLTAKARATGVSDDLISDRLARPRLDSGLYQLIIWLPEAEHVEVGRLGAFEFPRGYYVYTGSARRNLEARIARHLRKAHKRMRWHIDYLLKHSKVVAVKRYHGSESECELSRMVEHALGGTMVVRNFGSSDCRCCTHLFYFPRNPSRGHGMSSLRSQRRGARIAQEAKYLGTRIRPTLKIAKASTSHLLLERTAKSGTTPTA